MIGPRAHIHVSVTPKYIFISFITRAFLIATHVGHAPLVGERELSYPNISLIHPT